MIYVDRFAGGNSNYYWLESFKKFVPQVENIQIGIGSEKIVKRILEVKPDHIHFGGSVKRSHLFPIIYLEKIRKELDDVRITYFYGDGYYFTYQREIVKYIDKLLISHMPSDLKGYSNVEFVPCATSLDSYKIEDTILYEVSFIGNNYSNERVDDLKRVSKLCDLTIFGNGWKGLGLKCVGTLKYEDFPEVVSKSLFCLGSTSYTPCEWGGEGTCELGETISLESKLCCDEKCANYKSKYGYFSNRVMNLCACSGCVLLYYSEGLEEVFKDSVDILFFRNLEELKDKIDYFKKNIDDVKMIRKNAYKISRKYTFDNLVKRLLI